MRTILLTTIILLSIILIPPLFADDTTIILESPEYGYDTSPICLSVILTDDYLNGYTYNEKIEKEKLKEHFNNEHCHGGIITRWKGIKASAVQYVEVIKDIRIKTQYKKIHNKNKIDTYCVPIEAFIVFQGKYTGKDGHGVSVDEPNGEIKEERYIFDKYTSDWVKDPFYQNNKVTNRTYVLKDENNAFGLYKFAVIIILIIITIIIIRLNTAVKKLNYKINSFYEDDESDEENNVETGWN